ncbi:MAG: hypothetical protein ACKV2V_13970, partial [Blastocatellia bacterium]
MEKYRASGHRECPGSGRKRKGLLRETGESCARPQHSTGSAILHGRNDDQGSEGAKQGLLMAQWPKR